MHAPAHLSNQCISDPTMPSCDDDGYKTPTRCVSSIRVLLLYWSFFSKQFYVEKFYNVPEIVHLPAAAVRMESGT